MKSSTITLAVTLVLSSCSTISGMPHHRASVTNLPLSVRAPGYLTKRSLLDRQSTDHAPDALKRRHEHNNEKQSHSSGAGDLDDDDDDFDCNEQSDVGDQVDEFTDQYHKIGRNPTGDHTQSFSGSTQSNPHKMPSRHTTVLEEKSSKDHKTGGLEDGYKPSAHPTNAAEHYHKAIPFSSSLVNYGGSGPESRYHGKATFFTQDGNPGACGKTHHDTDYVVAIPSEMYEDGKFCGKTILVTRKSTGQRISCVAADACPKCPTKNSLDLSIAAFNALGNPDEGIFDILWEVIDHP